MTLDETFAARRLERAMRALARCGEIEEHLKSGGLVIENDQTLWPSVHGFRSVRELAEHLQNRESFWGPVRLVTRAEADAWITSKRAAYRAEAGPDALTRDEIVGVMSADGFRFVRTMGGRVPLADWLVSDQSENPIRPHLFVRSGEDRVFDYVGGQAFCGFAGVWQFTRDPGPVIPPCPVMELGPMTQQEAWERRCSYVLRVGSREVGKALAMSPGDAVQLVAWYRLRAEQEPLPSEVHVLRELNSYTIEECGMFQVQVT